MQNASATRNDVRPRRPLRAWFDVRRRHMGSWAFAINRLTGLGLAAYLFLHLAVLSTLLQGEAGWERFLQLARSPFFLLLDVVLIFGILFHGLNGIRVALVGMGVANKQQKGLFYGLTGIALVLFIVGAILIYTK